MKKLLVYIFMLDRLYRMRVGYLRFNLPVELDLDQASPTGAGCEIRSSFIVDLIAQGHEVYILQYVPPKDRYWARGSLLGFNSERERLLSEVKYVPIKSSKEYRVSKLDLDVLVIECGPTNTRFSFEENGIEMPFIKRTFLALADYEGDVVYYQHDILLPFPFGECLRDVEYNYVKSLSPINLTRMCYELGREILFFDNKRWIVLHNVLNEDFFLDFCNGKRYTYRKFYEDGVLKPRYISQTLISKFDKEELGVEPKPSPAYDLMYVGREKDKLRTELLLKYYDCEELKSCLIGEWKNKPWKHIVYLGVRGKQGDTIRFYNNSYATVFIPTEYMAKGGILTSRICQALLGGCIVFVHRDIYGIDKLVHGNIRDLTLVGNRSELLEKVKIVKSLDIEDREFIVEQQLKYLTSTYYEQNWNRILRW
ncbi:MAG: hypothetical protein DRP00_05700 [Candidatus Aenigmatarchaeota archaeon]|nr:MAG: hypothetical protein DRP00_05700 [Candidatus Aenigmarchaeota archaeon]